MRKNAKHINSSLEEVFGNSLADGGTVDEPQSSVSPLQWLLIGTIFLGAGVLFLVFFL